MLKDMLFKNQQAELVVLSACKTSQGEHKKGEGIMSIARSFTNSGAKSVISSLWDINQQSTNKITNSFYNNLKNGQSKTEALREAKTRYIKNNANTSEASPYYWSSIILNGNSKPIFNKLNFIDYIKYISILILVLSIIYFVLNKKIRLTK